MRKLIATIAATVALAGVGFATHTAASDGPADAGSTHGGVPRSSISSRTSSRTTCSGSSERLTTAPDAGSGVGEPIHRATNLVLEPGEARFDLAFAVRVGALDGRHPEAGSDRDRTARSESSLSEEGCSSTEGDPLRQPALPGLDRAPPIAGSRAERDPPSR